MATTRAVNPSGAKLLDESKAHPGSLDKSIFQQRQSSSSGAGQGTVNDNYLRECREDNPEPASQATEAKSQVQLSNCRILTPVESLKLNEEFEMAVDLKKLDSAAASTANFSLFATRTRDGKEERAKIWADKPGKAQDDKADPIVVKAKDILATQDDYQLGEKVVFELEATHEGAEAPCKSGPVEIGLKCLAKWVGGDNLFFRNDGEFPLLKDDASLVEVLATAVEYVQQMKPGAEESAVCFGYASSVGAANSNRKLSLRRAQAIKAILDRDFETWEALAKVNFTTIDIQQFLSDLHNACGWECDPGAVDGQSDPQTKAAILAFQKECNSRYRYGLKEDGACGPKTWRGVLRTIHGLIQAEIGGDPATEPNWNKPKWGHSGKGVYANGEDAATGGDKPEERSVQITFFAPGSEPALVDAPDGDPTNPELNPILNAERYEKEKLERQRRNAERARQAEEERRRGAETNGGGPTPPTEPEDPNKKPEKQVGPLAFVRSEHRPGIGNDMSFADYTEERYRAINSMCYIDGLPLGALTMPDEDLFTEFKIQCGVLFAKGSLFSNIMSMIDHMQGDSGSNYSNGALTNAVREHESYLRFVTRLEELFSTHIREKEGYAEQVGEISFLHAQRPIFNSKADMFWGLRIAINDTWAYDVDIQNYTPSEDGTFTADMRVTLYDHFGLDEPDLDISWWEPFKPFGLAILFRVWFILQHVRGYRPFVTVVETVHRIEGRYN